MSNSPELESFKQDYIDNRLSKIKRADQPNTYFFSFKAENRFFNIKELRKAVDEHEQCERELSEEFNQLKRV